MSKAGRRLEGKVLRLLGDQKVRLDIGARHGVEVGMRFALVNKDGTKSVLVKVIEVEVEASTARAFESFTSKDVLNAAVGAAEIGTGAVAGAAAGSFIGSILLPGLGTAIGAVVGRAAINIYAARRRRLGHFSPGDRVVQLLSTESNEDVRSSL